MAIQLNSLTETQGINYLNRASEGAFSLNRVFLYKDHTDNRLYVKEVDLFTRIRATLCSLFCCADYGKTLIGRDVELIDPNSIIILPGLFQKVSETSSQILSTPAPSDSSPAQQVSNPSAPSLVGSSVGIVTAAVENENPDVYATGKLRIGCRTWASVIGTGYFINRKGSDYHQKIEMCDGRKWREDRGDFLVTCLIEELTPSIPELTNREIILPGCLFYHTEPEFAFKKEGETIEFLYEGKKIVLQANNLKDVKTIYHNCYVNQKGREDKPIGDNDKDEISYQAPHLRLKERRKEEEINQIRRAYPSLEIGTHPKIPAYEYEIRSDSLTVILEVPGFDLANSKVVPLSNGTFAVCIPKARKSKVLGSSYVLVMEKFEGIERYDSSKAKIIRADEGVIKIEMPLS